MRRQCYRAFVGRVQQSADLVGSLSDISLPDGDNQEHRLGDLWASQTVVLIHLRHFGCILCRHYASKLRDSNAAFEQIGARIVAVGTGGREYAKTFVTERKIPFLVLVDKQLTTHDLIGIKSGGRLLIAKPTTLVAAAAAIAAGERQGKTGPNPFLFGAANVIAAGGNLTFSWLNSDYQDNAPVEELLTAAAEATQSTAPAAVPA
jgi:peroxiredoxin